MDFDYSGGLSWEARLLILAAFVIFLVVLRVLIRIASVLTKPSSKAERDRGDE